MIIQDGVAERRNLIVMSLAIIVYYWGVGEIVTNEARFLLVNVKFHNPKVLFIFVWVLFLYFIFRYWVTSKSFETNKTVRRKMKQEFYQLPINEKHHPHLMKEYKKTANEDSVISLKNWRLEYKDNDIKFSGYILDSINKTIAIKGFWSRWIFLKTLVRGYKESPNVNAYYTPYILAWLALGALSYNTYLKYCA